MDRPRNEVVMVAKVFQGYIGFLHDPWALEANLMVYCYCTMVLPQFQMPICQF
jgi:hypothetical protein